MYTIDRELKYCPECRDEYRPDFFVCASCNIELVKGEHLLVAGADERPEKVELPEIGEQDALTFLQAGGVLEMKKLKNDLADRGIPSLLAKEDNCSGGCCGPEIQLFIRMQDTVEAQGFLLALHKQLTGIQEESFEIAETVFDPQAATVQCPACMGRFIPESSVCPECGLQFL